MPGINNATQGGGRRHRWAPAGFALWRLGFRPFYLLASGFAALSVLFWSAQYAGWLPQSALRGPVWHAHELLFGFTLAVIAGFLFTAVRNWTSRPTPTGAWLMAIAALWIAGRVLVFTPYAWISAVANVAFPLAVAIGIGIPLIRSGNRRNYFFLVLLVLVAAAQASVHLTQIFNWALPAWIGIRSGLDLILFVISTMAGRVIPMFTANAVTGARPRRYAWLERAAGGVIVLLLFLDVLGVTGSPLVGTLAAAAVIHAVRLCLWTPHKTLGTPLVWILHAAYAWIPVHFVLRILTEVQWLASPLATHALTIGAIGGLTIGMMTRTARGHTGRPLIADRCDVASYALILLAAGVRVLGPLLAPQLYLASVLISAALWSAGFGLYAIRYWPSLTRPRSDGKPG